MTPGIYRITLPGGAAKIPDGVTLLGEWAKSTVLLDSSDAKGEYREFLRPGSDVTLEGLAFKRDAAFTGVLFPISGDVQDLTFRHCHIDGEQSRFAGKSLHAFRVGHGTVQRLNLEGLIVEDCAYGLFQTNQATGHLDGVVVERCLFQHNTSSDLEFNSPKGVMKNVLVRHCIFLNNRSETPSGGFAVGFANVSQARVEHCRIENYGSEALHVEDRSTDITLVGNTIVGGSLKQPNGVILVVNDSRRVTIEGNYIDARSNPNAPHLILVTAGGTKFKNPSEIVVKNNVLIHGEQTKTWYLQKGSSSEPVGNAVVPWARDAN